MVAIGASIAVMVVATVLVVWQVVVRRRQPAEEITDESTDTGPTRSPDGQRRDEAETKSKQPTAASA